MRLKPTKRFSLIMSVLLITSSINISSARALTVGNCSVTLGSTTGVVLVNSGGYCYLAFSSTGANSFTVPTGVSSSAVLVVAGGGAGGAGAWGGGGGAGGVVYAASYPLTAGATMNLSVGGGGAPGNSNLTPSTNRSNNGQDSWINSSSTFVAKGGGAGASYAYGDGTASNRNGSNGGSGGGGTEHASGGLGGTSTQTTPTYATTVYGQSGGASAAASNQSGAGGGGAGGVGTATTSSVAGGAGGAGTNAFSAWFIAIGQFGVNGYIAGGGGGGSNSTAGAAGSGGGGVGGGSTVRNGSAGTANTGSGGGGTSYTGSGEVAGAGGSGLIIFKFAEYVGPAVISAPSVSGTIYKGVTKQVTVTIDSAGKVVFYIDGKKIPSCIKVATTGSSPNFTATCNWKPSLHGSHSLSARIYPTNAAQTVQSSPNKEVYIYKRTTTR